MEDTINNKANLHYTGVLLDALADTISDAQGEQYDLGFNIGGLSDYGTVADMGCVYCAVVEMYDHRVATIKYDCHGDYQYLFLHSPNKEKSMDFAVEILNAISDSFLSQYPCDRRFASRMSYDRVYEFDRNELATRYLKLAKKYNKGEEFSGQSDLDLMLTMLDLSTKHSADIEEMEYFFLANTDSNLIASVLNYDAPQCFNIDEWSTSKGLLCPHCESDHTHPVAFNVVKRDRGWDAAEYQVLCTHCGQYFKVD